MAGVAPNRRVKSEEVEFIVNWVAAAEKYQDIRLVYGAFEHDGLTGFAGASIAESSDAKNGVELNYLFVKKEYRRRGLALKLIDTLLAVFGDKEFDQLIVYNHHYAPSNTFYRKLGGKVFRQDIQGAPLDRLEIDVFVFDFRELKKEIESLINERYSK